MKISRVALVVLAAFVAVAMVAAPARADRWDKDTKVTFSQPVEVPGKVLAAGTYRLRVMTPATARNVVQIWNQDGTELITTVLCIPDYRLQPTGETTIRFRESPAGTPAALRAWFYPGDNFGQEFVYPKARAVQLAAATHEVVPAEAAQPTPSTITTVPLVAVTPEKTEVPVEEAIQTTPRTEVAQAMPPAAEPTKKMLPKTGSVIPLTGLLGFAAISLAAGLRLLAKRIS